MLVNLIHCIFLIYTTVRFIYTKEEFFFKRPGRFLNENYFINEIEVTKSETECLGACFHTVGCQSFNVFSGDPIICQLFPNVSNDLTLRGNVSYFYKDYYQKKQEYSPTPTSSNELSSRTSDKPSILSTYSPNDNFSSTVSSNIPTINSVNISEEQVMLPGTNFNIKYDSARCFFHSGKAKFTIKTCSTTKQFKLQSDSTVTRYDGSACFTSDTSRTDVYQFVSKNEYTMCLKFRIIRAAATITWQMILLDTSGEKTMYCLKNSYVVFCIKCDNSDTLLLLD